MRLKRSSTVEKSIRILLRLVVKGGDRQGFTLIELLVSMLIASLIVSGLLYGVVEILQTNQKDASRSDTQRDMQMAMDYIARDVREATYVYGVTPEVRDPVTNALIAAPESCLTVYPNAKERGEAGKCTGLLGLLDDGATKSPLNKSGNVPVLAFWKPEPLPSGIRKLCQDNAKKIGTSTDPKDPLVITPCVAQRMYTLVIYSINTENGSNLWKGKARITRYQLPHFTENAGLGGITPKWAAPVAKDKRPLTWPIGDSATASGINLQQPGTPPQNNDVLTDFVDNDSKDEYKPEYCPNGFAAPSGYDLSGNPVKSFNRAFYVCVRSGVVTAATGSGSAAGLATATAAAAGQGLNPEVHIVIRGNAAGRGGIRGDLPFQMETRVLSRGVYGKLSN
jgi:prepilin-type N-terminal cleavage/methylation domain-containing protein